MNGDLSPNAQAILLLTAPLLAGKSRGSVKPLSLGEYQGLARRLHSTGKQPSDLLGAGALDDLNDSSRMPEPERLHRLLGRGFLLAQALERWRARAIWVVTRADPEYPRRLKKRLRTNAPPVLYGCGDRGAIDGGGLAVVGSRRVNDALIRYTERVGRLAASAHIPIVSGGARGVDQASMRGALGSGGRALGVLANGLERAALNRENREPLMDGRLVLVCPYDPAVRFLVGHAMQRNKFIYALSDAALVVNSDHGHGGTWAGATEQLGKLKYVPVYVRRSEEQSTGLNALVSRGAEYWPEPPSPAALHDIVSGDHRDGLPVDPGSHGEPQRELFDPVVADPRPLAVRKPAEAVLAHRGASPEESQSPSTGEVTPEAVRAAKRLLPAMAGEMTRQEILEALKLRDLGNLKKTYLDPCLQEGWIEMTMPDKPTSPKQRFRRTAKGRQWIAELRKE